MKRRTSFQTIGGTYYAPEKTMKKTGLAAIVPPTYEAASFTATKFNTAEEKAAFLHNLCRFVLKGCPESGFTKALYRHLHLHMGHIAHYNQEGFYAAQFATPQKRYQFLHYHADENCMGTWGDPAYTFSDVAKAFQIWIRTSGVLEEVEALAAKTAYDNAKTTAREALAVLSPHDRQAILNRLTGE